MTEKDVALLNGAADTISDLLWLVVDKPQPNEIGPAPEQLVIPAARRTEQRLREAAALND